MTLGGTQPHILDWQGLCADCPWSTQPAGQCTGSLPLLSLPRSGRSLHTQRRRTERRREHKKLCIFEKLSGFKLEPEQDHLLQHYFYHNSSHAVNTNSTVTATCGGRATAADTTVVGITSSLSFQLLRTVPVNCSRFAHKRCLENVKLRGARFFLHDVAPSSVHVATAHATFFCPDQSRACPGRPDGT